MRRPTDFASRRRASRLAKQSEARYEAAKVSREIGDWLPVDSGVNDLIRNGGPRLRARIRSLVRNFPYFSRAANVLVDYTVGTGSNFQSRVRDTSSGASSLDNTTIQKIEDAVSWWMDEADVAGRLHFGEIERLVKRQDIECGEFLLVKTNLRDPRRFAPYSLQVIEPDWLTGDRAKVAGRNLVDQGVEYDPGTGRPVAYHLADPESWKTPRRIPAEQVIHGFRTLRPGQLRGVSDFASAVLAAHDLGDYLVATMDTAKLAAKYLAMVETPDPVSFQEARTTTDAETGRKTEVLENAIIEYFRPGESITFAQNQTPGDSFDPFTRFTLRMIAVATGVSYELLSGDYGGLNYSSLRGIRNDVAKQVAPMQARHHRQFCQVAVQDAITSAVLAGKLDLPGYWRDPRPYWRAAWIAPGIESVDPLRETKAHLDQIDGGLRSPQEIVAARGRDYAQVLDEIAEAKAMAEARGLSFGEVKQAMAANPAALGADED